MNPINPASIGLSFSTIGRIENLLTSLNVSGPRLTLPPNLRGDFLARAETVLRETGALKPAQATLAPIDRSTYAYLFRFPGDPEQFSRLIAPVNRAPSSALELKPVSGYKLPLVLTLYRTLPELDRPLLSYFLHLSSVFGRVTHPDAYGEVQAIEEGNVAQQALMALLGAMATLSSVPPIPEEKVPAASKKRGPKAKAAEPEST